MMKAVSPQSLNKPKATIIIPHYQTIELITLCLRSIRKYTPPTYNVIVVDNNSQDESLQYLKSVKWINLIQRKNVENNGSWAHGSALDIGLENTFTDFFVSLHSDVIIRDYNWLNRLLAPMEQNKNLVCAGTGKIEEVSFGYKIFKKMGDVKGLSRFLKNKFTNAPDKMPPPYIRTTCAIYRTAVLKKENLSFLPRKDLGMTSGQFLYYELVNRGYQSFFFPVGELKKLIYHISHGTMILNPLLGARKRTISTGLRRIKKRLHEDWIKNLLEDSTLDYI
ncbi:MAG: glycosyltransferase [Desulfobacterota bacterium]|nr:glycosyltransferase [Thermodesulfobacteriota bacterium]